MSLAEQIRAGSAGRVAAWLEPLGWIPGSTAMACSVVLQAMRPLSWRRTVRAEFRRYLDLSCIGTLPMVIVAGILIGIGIVFQAIDLLEQLGQGNLVREIVVVLLVRDIAPVTVGLTILGRSGLILYSEISEAQRTGLVQTLDRMGIDPFLVLVMPRCIAIAIASFALNVVMVLVTLVAGIGFAKLADQPVGALIPAIDLAVSRVEPATYFLAAFKTCLIGLLTASVFAYSALDRARAAARGTYPLATAFLRAFLSMLAAGVAVMVLL